MPTSSSIRRVNGLDLHVEEAGPADGPLRILLHGFLKEIIAWLTATGP